MKQHYSLLVLLLVFLSSCVVIVDSTNANFQDELYYSSEEYAVEDAKDEVAYQQYLKENEVEEESIAHEEELYEEEFDYEDCYDYYYTSRLRRFHSPHLGFGYYNNYYTNSFWYSNNPYNLGVSIYYGYNFWNPWYADPWYNYHFGWGDPHHNPFYNSHWSYWHTDHYSHFNYYPTYFNTYDNNSVYYGVRQNNNQATPEAFANRYENEIKQLRPSRTDFVDVENYKAVQEGNKHYISNSTKPVSRPNGNPSSKDNEAWKSNSNSKKPVSNYKKPISNRPSPGSSDYKAPSRPKPNNRGNNGATRPARIPSTFKSNSSPSKSRGGRSPR
jgi:hypothetical protein